MNHRFIGTVDMFSPHEDFRERRDVQTVFDTLIEGDRWRVRPDRFVVGLPQPSLVTITLARVAGGGLDTATGRLWIRPLLRFRGLGLQWDLDVVLDSDITGRGFAPPLPPPPLPTVSGARLTPEGRFALAGSGRLDGPRNPGLGGTEVLVELRGRFEPVPAMPPPPP